MPLGGMEILIIIVIILVLFGPERISKLAGELGKGIKAFKDGISGDEKKGTDTKEDSSEKK